MKALPKSYRLRDGASYRRVYRNGRTAVSSRMVLYVLPRPGQPTQMGFVTGKKVGGAVARNRARRLMKEVYRLHRDRIVSGFWLVVVGRAPLAKATYAQAERDMIGLLKRTGVWR